jgi:hypothetical protein
MISASTNNSAILLRRYFECAAFVLLWMACGFYFHLSPMIFPLLGLPLVAGFQWAIARRPLAQLWARDAETFQVDRRTWIIAILLAVACGAALLSERGRVATGPGVLLKFSPLLIAALLPAAFALRRQRAAELRRAFAVIAIAVVIRVAWRVGWAPTFEGATMFPLSKLPDFMADFLVEFVALFLVDEVAFRGALDPHLAGAGTGPLHAWSSAVFVSILWSAWHFQVYHPQAKTFPQLLTQIVPNDFLPVIYGVALSFCARRSRTLAAPVAIHAAGNAYVLTLIK